MRPEFVAIVESWTSHAADDFESVTSCIERVAEWMTANHIVLSLEEAQVVQHMIRAQIKHGINRGDFDGLGVPRIIFLEALE